MALSTSVTAGTVMHGSKLKLVVWFWAAYLMATRFQRRRRPATKKKLGLGSYKSACSLSGLMEIDETAILQRTKGDPPAADKASC